MTETDIMESVVQLQDLRTKVLNGEEVSADEYSRVIEGLRKGRRKGASSGKKKKETLPPRDLGELFGPIKGKNK